MRDGDALTLYVSLLVCATRSFSGRHKNIAELMDEMADIVYDLQEKEDALEIEKS